MEECGERKASLTNQTGPGIWFDRFVISAAVGCEYHGEVAESAVDTAGV